MAKITAVIDIGSNSARMAIFEKTSRYGFHLIYEGKAKVRISEGCYEHGGVLQDAPMQRAIYALQEFRAIAHKYKARKLLCVATSAVRDAPNCAAFLARARRESGIAIKVIDGESEARYGGIACANLSHKHSGITIDIGGGSTECALIHEGEMRDVISLPLGTIRLKELFFDHRRIDEAIAYIKQVLQHMPTHFTHQHVFGIGGTIRALAKIHSKQRKYPIKTIHGYEMCVKDIIPFITHIYKAHSNELATIGVSYDRRDSIQTGALIFALLLEHMGAKSISASGVGVREGVFLCDMLRTQKYRFPQGIYPSLLALLDCYKAKKPWGKKIAKESSAIFEALASLHGLSASEKRYVYLASYLCDVGVDINFYGRMRHGAYIVLHGLDYGFSHTDRAILSLLLAYCNKRIPKEHDLLTLPAMLPISHLQWLCFILALASALCLNGAFTWQYHYKHGVLSITQACKKARHDIYVLQESIARLITPDTLQIRII